MRRRAAVLKVVLGPLAVALRAAPRAEHMAMALGHGSGRVTPRELASAYASLATTEGESWDLVHAGLVETVASPQGTGREAAVEGMSVAGKTGTVDVDGTDRMHAWFVGYAPAEAPRVLVLAYVEGQGTGGSLAAPLAGQVLTEWSKRCR